MTRLTGTNIRKLDMLVCGFFLPRIAAKCWRPNDHRLGWGYHRSSIALSRGVPIAVLAFFHDIVRLLGTPVVTLRTYFVQYSANLYQAFLFKRLYVPSFIEAPIAASSASTRSGGKSLAMQVPIDHMSLKFLSSH